MQSDMRRAGEMPLEKNMGSGIIVIGQFVGGGRQNIYLRREKICSRF